MKTINRISLDSVSSVCSKIKFSEMASCCGGGNNYSVDTMVHSHTKNGFNPSLIPDNYFQQFLGVFVGLTICFSATASWKIEL